MSLSSIATMWLHTKPHQTYWYMPTSVESSHTYLWVGWRLADVGCWQGHLVGFKLYVGFLLSHWTGDDQGTFVSWWQVGVQESKLRWISPFQTFAHITPFNIPLAKANQVTILKPRGRALPTIRPWQSCGYVMLWRGVRNRHRYSSLPSAELSSFP